MATNNKCNNVDDCVVYSDVKRIEKEMENCYKDFDERFTLFEIFNN